MSSDILKTIVRGIVKLIEKVLGVEFRLTNLNLRPKNLVAVGIILFITGYITVGTPLLQTMDSLVKTTNTDWIHLQALSSFRMSFVTTPIHLSLLCLFKDVKNPLLKFKNTFAALLVGFIGVYVMLQLLPILPSSVPRSTDFILGLFPFITVAIVRLSISSELKS